MRALALPQPITKFPVAARRNIAATILTDLGWVSGEIVIPKINSFVDYLNTNDGYVKVTNVTLKGYQNPLNFLALGPEGYTLIVPNKGVENLDSVRLQAEPKETSITCLFEKGWVSGTLELNRLVRLSDFLTVGNRCFVIKDCTLNWGESRSRFPAVLVNGRRLVGITETTLH